MKSVVDIRAGADLLDSAHPAAALIRGRHGHFMVPKHDIYVGKSMLAYGEYNRQEQKLLSQILSSGMAFIEVGAHMGAHSVPMAQAVGAHGYGMVIEVQPFLYQLLRANLTLNALSHVDTALLAAGAARGIIELYFPDYHQSNNFGGYSLDALKLYSDNNAPASIEMNTLDAVYMGQRLDLIKIDAEGMEYDILCGAEQLIAQYRPMLYVENDRRHLSARLIKYLFELNYLLYWHLPPLFDKDNYFAHPYNHYGSVVSINVLALPREIKSNIKGLHIINTPEDWPISLGET